MTGQWHFGVDRGGTFTDIVARTPEGKLVSHKLLSDNLAQYDDATIAGIGHVLDLYPQYPRTIANVRIGTTVATNALLERKGEPTALVTTAGFGDSLSIGYQHREQLFALNIVKARPLYDAVIEIDERIGYQGEIIEPLCIIDATKQLNAVFAQGISSVAIVLMHAYKYPEHELMLASLALDIGFSQISVSHEVSQLIKLISRADTTVVDAYLSPKLRQYVEQISSALGNVKVEFMQSSGGLVSASHFRGKDAVLSGPAGGVVAMAQTSQQAGVNQVIGFDMGGTSTDVSLYNDGYEREWHAQIAGVRLCAPMMSVHTVAAGGGSILDIDGARLTVGPHSAGAFPGPSCYRNDGPLAVTDINVLHGKIQPDLFGQHFGQDAKQSLSKTATEQKFAELTALVNRQTNQHLTPNQLASGYLTIAVEHMANAIKEISVAKGHDLNRFAMSCFGGAGAQHACLVADVLGVEKIIIHPLSGVLSAYGMGLATLSVVQQQTLDLPFDTLDIAKLMELIDPIEIQVRDKLSAQGVAIDSMVLKHRILLRCGASDNNISLELSSDISRTTMIELAKAFNHRHHQVFGFVNEGQPLIVSAIECEGEQVTAPAAPEYQNDPCYDQPKAQPFSHRQVYFDNRVIKTPFYRRDELSAGMTVTGPAIIVEQSTTVVIEPNWQATIDSDKVVHLVKYQASATKAYSTAREPMLLEVFNNLFMHIAKEMGLALQASAMSVNIKERLDFSCAIFDAQGALVANAPHMPVHLGSMASSVKQIIDANQYLSPGDSYLVNSPYHGGTHLPDLTVVTPVFDHQVPSKPIFFVASRGHHADIGGISPGSMPAHSSHIEQEGILFDNFLLVSNGVFNQQSLIEALSSHRYPARNITQNISDLKAQLAANNKGIAEMRQAIEQYGLSVVIANMDYVQDAAQEGVREVIKTLDDGEFSYGFDHGGDIKVKLSIDKVNGNAVIDFSGTSAQQDNNFNAPLAVTRAAVLYVFRTLVDKPIALNDGCLRPLTIVVPSGSMLNPVYPAAVVTGNVETSQVVTDALYGALGKLAASQGTMNNFTFGNEQVQYYETICGGSGAGQTFDGCDAVQSHMTNSRLTDPEVLESRFPVRLNRFSIRESSGGSGAHHGGCGVVREMEFLAPMQAGILSNRRKVAPFGLHGGSSGKLGHSTLIKANNQVVELGSCESVSVDCGDKIVIATPGGGGYGRQE